MKQRACFLLVNCCAMIAASAMIVACANNGSPMQTFTVFEKKLLGDPTTKKPIACTTDANCQDPSYTNVDKCYAGNACNSAGYCEALAWASCLESPPYPLYIGCSATPTECDDGNACTYDVCNGYLFEGKGGCQHPALSGGLKFACGTGECTVEVMNCVDGEPNSATDCTAAYASVQGKTCDDNNICTSNDACASGTCTGIPNTVTCDDGVACTYSDTCSGGTCSGTPITCTSDTCNTRACNGTSTCAVTFTTSACDDGVVCTTGDACANGTCTGTPDATACNDGNVCTDDSCNPTLGCMHTNNTAACDDGNTCTYSDTCSGGTCSGTPITCTSDTCNTRACNGTSTCAVTFTTSACDDGVVCTTGDACANGTCTGTPDATACNDGNICTDDSCNPTLGCMHTNNTAACDDGNTCTYSDTCSGGTCSGTPITCTSDTCNTRACNGTSTCAVTFTTSACDDGNACTSNDACSGGTCTGTVNTCNDGNVCTDDSCNPADGSCTHTNNTATCSDGNACTVGDACSGGTCVPGPVTTCDDGNPCTDDSCNTSTGCVYVNNTATCTDGNACTVNDACSGGTCVPGPVTTCDDGNPCTLDSCDPSSGCIHTDQCIPESPGHCADGIDNDMNGLTDCQDPECANDPACYQDKCTSAGTISCGGQFSGSTGASGLMDGYNCAPTWDMSAGEQYVTFTPNFNGSIYAVLSGEKSQRIFVLSGQCVPSACVKAGYSAVTVTVTSGTTYFIGADTSGGAVGGPYTILLSCTPQ